MPKPKVLLDTNILTSGLIFLRGNEHKILKLAEDKKIILVLPDFVVDEMKKVLARNFPGHEVLLDIFLSRIECIIVPWAEIEPFISIYEKYLRDKNDTPILVSTVLAKPDFVITGDITLREDLKRCHELSAIIKICSSKQFLEVIEESS